MGRVNGEKISLSVGNIYNCDELTSDEVKVLFNQKLLKMIYELEKKDFG